MKANNPKQAERELREKLTQEISKVKNGEISFDIRGK